MSINWYEELQAAITVCDRMGIIVYMNEYSAQMFADEGGYNLIGKNLLDCHPGLAREKLQALLDQGKTNCYTIEKNGQRKMVYQAPWYNQGHYCGIVELALPLPDNIPHYLRK